MTFDAGTWWLVGILTTALVAAVTYLVKRSVFGRVDKCERSIEEIREKYLPRETHERDFDACAADIEAIKESYATKGDLKDLRTEIKTDLQKLMVDVAEIKKNSLLREDFFRAQVSNEQHFQRIYDLFLKNGAGGKQDG